MRRVSSEKAKEMGLNETNHVTSLGFDKALVVMGFDPRPVPENVKALKYGVQHAVNQTFDIRMKVDKYNKPLNIAVFEYEGKDYWIYYIDYLFIDMLHRDPLNREIKFGYIDGTGYHGNSNLNIPSYDRPLYLFTESFMREVPLERTPETDIIHSEIIEVT